ncbi:MarR family transcriptional regulator [Pseudonocardia kujensis]|uniref:MarR family winged helix-turn-helix transcriptional regulator n=1 Tax=Pseudonocardia kujensis TaxID=1128675 RepID=UPI001E57A1DA|nr:MarR family transcriptional regulator [Pseudonocardia kujensis]MCE0762752.1 MarR family transcriptional regulator [Pseudonocardia kujensis]
MISTSTASDLVEAIREFVGLGRLARQLADAEPPAEGSCVLHPSSAGLLGLLVGEGEQRLGVLAASLDVDASVISRRVAALEEAGLVARRPDPQDRRAQLVGATDRGRAALVAYREHRAEQVAAALAHRTDEEVGRIAGELRGLVADLHRIPPAPRRRSEPAPTR